MELRKLRLTREEIRQRLAEMERLGLMRFPKHHPKHKHAVQCQTEK